MSDVREVVNDSHVQSFVQPHLSTSSSSSLPFYHALQQLLGDAVVSARYQSPMTINKLCCNIIVLFSVLFYKRHSDNDGVNASYIPLNRHSCNLNCLLHNYTIIHTVVFLYYKTI